MWEQAKTNTARRRDENARAHLYTLYSLTRRLKTYIFKFHLYELWIGATGIYKRNLIHIDLMYKQQHIEVNMSYIECVWYTYIGIAPYHQSASRVRMVYMETILIGKLNIQ